MKKTTKHTSEVNKTEERMNIAVYYIVLGISLSFFIFISVISFIWGR